MKPSPRCIKSRLLAGIWLLSGSVFLSLGLVKFWTDSEMWAVSASKFLFNHEEYFLAIKPLFHGLLWINFQISEILGVYPIDLARFFWGLIGLAIMFLSNEILKIEGLTRKSRLLFQGFLFGTTTWIYRASEVRSDITATLLFLICLYLCLRPLKSQQHKVYYLLIGFVLCLLTTGKSVFIFIGSLPLLIHLAPEALSSKPNKRSTVILSLLTLSGMLIFYDSFWESFKFFLRQFHSPSSVVYFSQMRVMHLVRSIKENPHIALLLFSLLFYGFKIKLWKKGTKSRPYAFSALAIFGLLWVYPDPLPFFIAGFLPLFFLYTFISLKDIINQAPQKLVVGLVFLLSLNFFYGISQVFSHTNFQQRSLAEWAIQEFKDRHEIIIYDPTGFYTPMNGEHWFLGPAMSPEDYTHLSRLISTKRPEVIFYTQKLMYLEPEIRGLFARKYYQWAPFLFLSADRIDTPIQGSCEEVEKQLQQDLFKRKKNPLYPVSALATSAGGERKLTEWASLDEFCKVLNQGPGEIFIFATQPPGSPGDNLVDLFRYDPFF